MARLGFFYTSNSKRKLSEENNHPLKKIAQNSSEKGTLSSITRKKSHLKIAGISISASLAILTASTAALILSYLPSLLITFWSLIGLSIFLTLLTLVLIILYISSLPSSTLKEEKVAYKDLNNYISCDLHDLNKKLDIRNKIYQSLTAICAHAKFHSNTQIQHVLYKLNHLQQQLCLLNQDLLRYTEEYTKIRELLNSKESSSKLAMKKNLLALMNKIENLLQNETSSLALIEKNIKEIKITPELDTFYQYLDDQTDDLQILKSEISPEQILQICSYTKHILENIQKTLQMIEKQII